MYHLSSEDSYILIKTAIQMKRKQSIPKLITVASKLINFVEENKTLNTVIPVILVALER